MKSSSKSKRPLRIIIISLGIILAVIIIFWFFDIVLNGMIVDWFENNYMTTYEEYIPDVGKVGIIHRPNWDMLKQLLFVVVIAILFIGMLVVILVSHLYAKSRVRKNTKEIGKLLHDYILSEKDAADIFPENYGDIATQMSEIKAQMRSQKKLLSKYAKDHHFPNPKFYVDDGYTGTNFNRPGFQEMIGDIEAGYVTTVIVKDMSRLGRNYLQVGYYTDTFFPDHNVRFIAINDGVDSEQGEDDFTPFRNIMNEWYAKDISRKVRSSKKLRGNAGDPLCLPPYGYRKAPDNPKQWIIDEEAAEVVRKIYRLCIEGNGIETTARILQESGILTPTYYWAKKGIRKGGKKTQDNPCKWCKTTITKILTLQEYTGVLINFKTYSKSFKDKRRRENPEENQRVFENHHEPIIDRSTWETVQKIRAGTKRRQPKNSEKNMFAGLLYCADCGHKLHYNINHPNSAIEYFNCSNYRGNRGTCNETHYVRADSLEQVVLLELNRMVSYLQENEEEFAELLARKTSQDYEREKRFRQQKLAELNARYSEVDMLFERTYEDNVSGKLSDERFMKLSQRYDEEQQSLKKEIAELESICDKEDSRVYSKNQFLKAVRKFMQMKTLTPTMLHELVERIDVYHIQGTGKNRTQRLVIHYKFVGVLDLPHSPVLPGNVVLNSRQGVEIEYLVGKAG